MAIQSKLTRRDKILIYFCIILVIAAGAYFFLISPMLTTKEELEEDLLNLTSQADAIQADSIMHGIISEQNSEFIEAYNAAKEGFYQPVFNDEADDYITRLLQQNNIEPTSMSIVSGDGSDTEITPYNYDTDDDSTTNFISVTSVQEVSVNISCNGRVTNLKNFIDALYAQDGIYVESYSYTLSNDEQSLNTAVQAALSAQSLTTMSINNPNATASASISLVLSTYDEENFQSGLSERAAAMQSVLDEESESEEAEDEEPSEEEE